MKPVGPEGPQVYWKRRALVVGIALLVLLILFLIFRPKGGDEEQNSAPVSPSPSPSVTPVSPSPSVSGSPSGSPTPASRTCPDTDIQVTVTPDRQAYPADAEPEIALSIVNTGSFACQRDVGAGANEIVISSGGVQVWSSDDCNSSNEADLQTLEPGTPMVATVPWPRTESASGCSTDSPTVAAGAYEAVGRNGKVESEPAAFTLQ